MYCRHKEFGGVGDPKYKTNRVGNEVYECALNVQFSGTFSDLFRDPEHLYVSFKTLDIDDIFNIPGFEWRYYSTSFDT